MTKQGLMDGDIDHILVSEEQIRARVKELGEQISRDYAGEEIVLLCILKGACVFFTDLARALDLHIKMEFMAISSYGNSRETSGVVRINKDMDMSITGRHVLIAEDIMDSGLTLSHLKKLLSAREHKGFLIAQLEGVADVNAAQALKNRVVQIARADARLPRGAFFLQDIIGASVVDESGAEVGTLAEVLELPTQRVYVVRGETEHLIPAVPAFILNTDAEAGVITVRLIEGM